MDTIEEHTSIIIKKGYVWWGWWKKEFEPDLTPQIEQICSSSTDVYILDRSTKRLFIATAIGWSRNLISNDEVDKIPTYYKENRNQVHGWFRLTGIKSISFDISIFQAFGDETLVLLPNAHLTPLTSNTAVINKSSILVLSDLHFGSDYAFLPKDNSRKIGDPRIALTECIMRDLKRMNLEHEVAWIIVSGDFTTRGCWTYEIRNQIISELKDLQSALGILPESIDAIPGNHDVIRYREKDGISVAQLSVQSQTSYEHEREFRYFIEDLTGRRRQDPLNYTRRIELKKSDVIVTFLNSCTICATNWTEYGYVGENGIDAVRQSAAESEYRKTFRLLVMHHHLLPVNQIEEPHSKGVTISLDAAEILERAQEAGIDIVLHGHQHKPKISAFRSIPLMGKKGHKAVTVIANGSAGSARLPGDERNSYSVLTFENQHCRLLMRELRFDGEEGATLFNDYL